MRVALTGHRPERLGLPETEIWFHTSAGIVIWRERI